MQMPHFACEPLPRKTETINLDFRRGNHDMNMNTNTNTNMATAAQRTLGIPELLEVVLSRVDVKTLLLAQRTCRTWRQVIQESKTLRQSLFLQPSAFESVDIGLPREALYDVATRPRNALSIREFYINCN